MLKQLQMDVKETSADAVKDWYDRNEILLVDVRETSEFEKEHIPGALLLPLSSFDPELFPTLNGKKVVLYCAIGKRSEAAGKMLLKEGHLDVVHMSGGMNAWKAAGYETEEVYLPPEPKTKEPAKQVFQSPHPGVILQDEYLKAFELSQADLAGIIGISEATVGKLVAGEIALNVELSLRLARYFCTASDFWVRLQLEHDLEQTRYLVGEQIRAEVTPRCAA